MYNFLEKNMKKKYQSEDTRITEDTKFVYDGKVPPQAIELEQQVLGAILIDNMSYNDISTIIRPEYLYRPAHRTILMAMNNLDNRNEPMDPHTVIEELKRMGKLDEIGGVGYILELGECTSSSAFAKQHSLIIYHKHILRDLIHITSEILSGCFDQTADPFKLLEEASRKILDTSESIAKKKITPLTDDIEGVYAKLGARKGADKNSLPGVPTGYHLLDDLTLGFQKSELIIVAARPSHGKTALTLNIARNAGKEGYKIAYFSLEMTKMEIITRLLSGEARVDGLKLKSGKTSEAEWSRVAHALSNLKIKLFIDDTSEMNVLELRAKARRLKHEHDIDMVIVDYLQLLKGESNYERRDLEVAHVSRSLKALAKELDIPVVAAAQLNRGIEQRGKEVKPQLSDLRESGSIEQDADVVIFIHREFLRKHPQKGDAEYETLLHKAEILIGKQRNGPPGHLELVFNQEYARFDNPIKDPKIGLSSEYYNQDSNF